LQLRQGKPAPPHAQACSRSQGFPNERSDLSHWRKRLGDKLELLLAESLRVAHKSGALRSNDLKRVTVDSTVQPKNISFPTDAKLLHAAIRGLNRLANKRRVRLRQSYLRVAKRAAMMAGATPTPSSSTAIVGICVWAG
jgi:transposase, IS5 family